MNENRLVDIETKLAYLEDSVDELIKAMRGLPVHCRISSSASYS